MFSELVHTPPFASTRVGSSHAETRPGAYGEAEFIFASIKVITIVGLIILGIVIDLGGGASLVLRLIPLHLADGAQARTTTALGSDTGRTPVRSRSITTFRARRASSWAGGR